MASPRSIRLEPATNAGLAAFASCRPGLSQSGAAALLIEEGLRMNAHPDIVFRDGPAGRRAVVIGGPDVWEVVRAVKGLRESEPAIKADALPGVLEESTGVQRHTFEAAVAYYSAYPHEIDERIQEESRVEQSLMAAIERRQDLLGA